eukprot:12108893-Alexandrium_andersonii.AAC.1
MGGQQQPLGQTAHGVLGRACAPLGSESPQSAELVLRPMMVLSTAQTLGVPRGHDTPIREISCLAAPWHSVVVGDVRSLTSSPDRSTLRT